MSGKASKCIWVGVRLVRVVTDAIPRGDPANIAAAGLKARQDACSC
ncbi:hypothetical protein CcI6DRAFT_02838 [Frankia sp. CcI6]|nr:hypothetical protein CcI6DRAFT_02838 [Frankia sp. CcI6]OAA29323.1 hypothetical protein AAY23_101662 [Frankia casuarinae]